MANHTCANCAHTHPATTAKGVTRISGSCDSCDCKAFRHASSLGVVRSGQLNSDDTPGAALEKENAALKQHVQQLRERVPQTDGAFASAEMEQLRQDAARAHVDLANARADHGKQLRELKQHAANLELALTDAHVVVASLLTITNQAYSAYTHTAVANGVRQVSDKLEAALALTTRPA